MQGALLFYVPRKKNTCQINYDIDFKMCPIPEMAKYEKISVFESITSSNNNKY
jgi:hypothetical protein